MMGGARSGTDRLEAAATLLARAFHDDPVARALHRNARRRVATLQRVFARQLGEPGSILFTATRGSAMVGCALWHRGEPHRERRSITARAGEFVALLLDPVAALRVAAAAPALRRLHQSCSPPGAHTLVALGVDPRHQGAGIGTALVERGLCAVDAAAAHCYLETANPRNIDFYQRLGFAPVGRAAPRGSPPIVAMVRAPGAPATNAAERWIQGPFLIERSG
jgi:ribosomal protein S18 acetylase RimI-like enzyme